MTDRTDVRDFELACSVLRSMKSTLRRRSTSLSSQNGRLVRCLTVMKLINRLTLLFMYDSKLCLNTSSSSPRSWSMDSVPVGIESIIIIIIIIIINDNV